MSLEIGDRVGPYEVVSALGVGGMGEVYRARDSRLGREVAIKVLAADLRDDPELRQRLDREAEAASALNHPNICTVYDVGEHDGRPFIVMECLEGQALNERLADGPMAADEVVRLAREVADALAAAHARNIVHRDIKPANLFLTDRGAVKVLDFGIAKLRSEGLAAATQETSAATLATPQLTSPGTTLGTFAYMSPEQARGDDVDGRSDLFSLGVVLYEAAAGVNPFSSTTAGRTLEAVLTLEPAPLSSMRSELPEGLGRILERLLEKDVELRFQNAADLGSELKRLTRDTSSSGAAVAAGSVSPPSAETGTVRASAVISTETPRRSSRTGLVIGAAAVIAATLAGWWFLRSSPAGPVNASEWEQLTDFSDSVVSPSFSPDGNLLTYLRGPDTFVTQGELYVQRLPDGEPVRLTDDGSPKMDPHFTHDGQRVAFSVALGRVDTVPLLGGERSRLLPNASAMTWTGPDRVMFSEFRTGIHLAIVSSTESRGESRDIYIPESVDGMAHRSYLSPDGENVLIAEMEDGWVECRVVPFDGSSKGQKVGPSGGACTSGAWSPDGRWVYLTVHHEGASHIWRQRFPGGDPERFTDGPTEEAGVAMAPDGRSIVTSVGIGRRQLFVDRGQGAREVQLEGEARGAWISADGNRVYYATGRAARLEIRRLDFETDRRETLLAVDRLQSVDLLDDESRIAYSVESDEGGYELWIATVDRSSAPVRVAENAAIGRVLLAGPDEVFYEVAEDGANYVHRQTVDGTSERVFEFPVVSLGDVSSDGRWLLLRLSSTVAESVLEGDVADLPIQSTSIYLADSVSGRVVLLCGRCFRATWNADQSHVVFDGRNAWQAYAVPDYERLNQTLPRGFEFGMEGAISILEKDSLGFLGVAPAVAADPRVYAVLRNNVQRNLYRVPIP